MQNVVVKSLHIFACLLGLEEADTLCLSINKQKLTGDNVQILDDRSMLNRRGVLVAGAGALAGVGLELHAQPAADTYPNKPIRFVVPIAAGGVSDAQARVLSDELKKSLGVPVLVDNRPGGNFGIGMAAAASAPADGYTMVWIFGAAVALNPMLFNNLPYKVPDFEFLTTIAKGHHVLAVPKNASARSLREFVDQSKADKGPTPFGVSSAGGTSHLIAEELGGLDGFNVQPVVYRGEAPAVLDLVAGTLPAFVGVVPSIVEHYKTGNVRVLAVTAEQRLPELPDVPTFAELGYKNFVWTYWAGLAVRKGTPPAAAEILRKAVVAAMDTQAFKDQARKLADTHLIPSTQKEFEDLIRSDTERWGRIIRTRHVSVQQ